MKTVIFTLTDTEPTGVVLQHVREVADGFVEQLFPHTRSPALAKRYFLSLPDDADLGEQVRRLGAVPGVEGIEVPPRREIID